VPREFLGKQAILSVDAAKRDEVEWLRIEDLTKSKRAMAEVRLCHPGSEIEGRAKRKKNLL
jgi:hypothetical protein